MFNRNSVFAKRNNTTTLSVYVYNVTARCFDEETETIEKHTFELYNEKMPSQNALKSDLELAGLSVIGKVLVELNTEKSGLYKMSHETFVQFGERIGDVRPKKASDEE